MRAALALTALGALCACGQGENDAGPGGVTVGEARALDEAAEMLEERRMPEEVVSAVPTDVPSPAAAQAE
ncbi:hypothetical protein GCM10011371_26600 [Novosphingobium marinum]|uniref:Uncharacterized protein n=1 Tax=Novosphingobium marinum TaxID=1514948 RepID=A0A7Y9XUA3_9SPHN|nr:hypothetical protein [Novosphingobium marinum]NYH94724.1 hypothetical protein [Novosphingobium marinum]GGC37835.1 hypothetical protein GCM10011371_26600 [Novosphingobium marinum]